MKILMLAALAAVLAGCATAPPIVLSTGEPPPAWQAEAMRTMEQPVPASVAPPMSAQELARRTAAGEAANRDRQAATICAARGRMVGAQTLGQGAVASVFAENMAARACLDAYRATGAVPSL